MTGACRRAASLAYLIAAAMVCAATSATAQTTDTVRIRDHQLIVHVYGTRGGTPVVVSSGDGGWVHLGPQVAALLASRGFFVVGFDVKAYLESFTSGTATLRMEDVPGDYRTLLAYAGRGSSHKPVLVGVSEGAGLSVLAASDAVTKAALGGVVALGLPDVNELGWRWKDALIYVTHGVPKEPTFSTRDVVARSRRCRSRPFTRRTTSSCPSSEVRDLLTRRGPALEPCGSCRHADHRFSDNLPEFERRLTRGHHVDQRRISRGDRRPRPDASGRLPAMLGLGLFLVGARGPAPRAAQRHVARRSRPTSSTRRHRCSPRRSR